MIKEKITTNKKDLLITIAITVLVSILLISFDVFESFIEFTSEHEDYELDEVLLILFTFSIVSLWFTYRRYKESIELRNILEKYNDKLEIDNQKKDELLLQQMKMATLGEMIQNIAHQWRQPLNGISMSASSLVFEDKMGTLDSNVLNRSLENIIKNTEYLSETIDNFRGYIKENHASKDFNLNENIQNCLDLVSASIKNSFIDIKLDLNTDFKMNSYPSELTQVLINIINNAKDALEINKVEEKHIFISSTKKNDKAYISILDNAGGIDEKIINKIFEPYFSTKENLNGTGLGLYMSYKLIHERFKGELLVENCTYEHNNVTLIGAKFQIILPLIKE